MPSIYKPKDKELPTRYRKGFISRMDGRQEIVRRLQTSFESIADDLGGAENLSYLRLGLIERAVFLEYQCRQWEQGILEGTLKEDAMPRWIQACNSLQGLCKTLGLSRQGLSGIIDGLYEPDGDDEAPADTAENAREGAAKARKPKAP